MTSKRPIAKVDFSELLDAFELDSFGDEFDHHTYINADSGAIFWVSPDHDLDDEVPEDFETSDRYITVPRKRDLNLGRDLALSFADEELPDHYDTVDGFFRKKGAYRRFKGFLEGRGLLEGWYAYEKRATEEALRSWCRENAIPLIENAPPA
jgi:hypothetical protein